MGDNDFGSTPPSAGGGGGMRRKECTDHLRKIFRTPKVRIVLDGLGRHKCRETTCRLFKCNEPNVRGVHHKELGIIICHNNAQSYEALEATFLHELIHEYDYCRFPKMKESIYDKACSEIRAYRLGNNYEPEIVKACAISSLVRYFSEAEAKSAVEAMWDTCYNDTEPLVGPDQVNWGSRKNDKGDTKQLI